LNPGPDETHKKSGHLDLVVVAAGDEQGLLLVEVDAADGALVPELDDAIVKTGRN
jgi:hypothetical protein